MRKYLLLLFLFSITFLSYSQEKKFSSFELFFDIPQLVQKYNNWPILDLESITFYNDTIFTLLIKENNLTSIPLNKKGDKVEGKKITLPQKCSPFAMARNKEKWYIATRFDGVKILDENGNYKNFIEKSQELFCYEIMFINNQILLFENNSFDGQFSLYDINGKLIKSSKKDDYVFTYPFEYNNIIRDGFNDITVKNNTIHISEQYYLNNDGNESFVGGCQNMGYFVEREYRKQLIIKDLVHKSEKERFNIPVIFKDTDLGVPEEDLFNLRVFSQDNNTFYFVTLKRGHLLIYKAVR